ncbi:glycosyltransferase [Cetobacterium sp.]|uniref:glycosyltransferase n=1 Tax=Cetobacterium sp. TaxID=2071632 RepID=UPI003F3CB394
MKKVLHIVGGMDVGGTETMLMNLYRNIDREKYQFHFISYYGREGFYDKEIEKLGGKIIHLNFSKRLGAFNSILELKRVIKENNYHVIHTHTLFNCGIGVFAAWLAGTKIRISHAHTVFEEKRSFVKKCYIFLMKKMIRIFSTNYCACSNKAAQFLFYKEIESDKKYKFIPNYIDYKKFAQYFNSKKERELFHFKADEIVIGHVGRIMSAKNHIFLIDIIAKMKARGLKVRGLFVGDGDSRKELELEIKKHSLENDILITGMVKNPEKYFSMMDVFVLPSFYEGFGLVLLEAQSSGLNCIASTAVQDEADLNIGLLERYNLDSGAQFWSEKIESRIKNKKIVNLENISEAFIKKGYDFTKVISSLDEIYRGEK